MKEKEKKVLPGLQLLLINLLILAASVLLVVLGIIKTNTEASALSIGSIVAGGVVFIVWCVFTGGFFTLQPNEAAVLILFGEYKGTVKKSGWFFTNPFYTKKKVSLRSRNLNGEKLKVNDEPVIPLK
jgi:uncharacterized membrane protein YqiK